MFLDLTGISFFFKTSSFFMLCLTFRLFMIIHGLADTVHHFDANGEEKNRWKLHCPSLAFDLDRYLYRLQGLVVFLQMSASLKKNYLNLSCPHDDKHSVIGQGKQQIRKSSKSTLGSYKLKINKHCPSCILNWLLPRIAWSQKKLSPSENGR